MTQSTDSALPSKVQEIVADCPQFRILVMGKTGCGKSSLINEVFGISDAQVSDTAPGKADIDREFSSKDNDRFILHDSQGFEPGEDANFNTVKNFIEKRSRMSRLKDRLHAIWICISIPIVGDRVAETGVEKIVEMNRGEVPIIIVFTKYDHLVNSAVEDAMEKYSDLDDYDEQMIFKSAREKAEETFNILLANTLEKTFGGFGRVPALEVSAKERYRDTIVKLIKVTDEEVQRNLSDDGHTKPASLAWAIAQRGSSDTNIQASIDVGKKRYWSGLLAGTDFTGRMLRQCFDVIHGDIVSVWNIHDPKNYLMSEDFKTKFSVIIDDLVTNQTLVSVTSKFAAPSHSSSGGLSSNVVATLTSASSPAGLVVVFLKAVVTFAKWVYDIYQYTPGNIACLMGYIVDLTIIMHRLFKAEPSPPHESIISVVKDFENSGELTQVHNDIRNFISSRNLLSLSEADVLDEMIRLITRHRVDMK